MKTVKFVFMAVLLLGIAACSNGNDSSSISSNNPSFTSGVKALSVAEKVTVVDAKSSGVSGAALNPAEQGTAIKADTLYPGDFPGDSDWYADITKIWVSERSAEVFNSVNNVLCLVSKLDYQSMLNQGDYVAQLDMSKCENQTDAAGRLSDSQQSSSSDSHPNYTRWVINSSRADSTSPHIVNAWVEMTDDSGVPQGIIYVHMTITEAKSDTNPLGIFRLDYGGHPYLVNTTTPDTSTWIMKGFLETKRDEATGDVLLYYSSDEQQGSGGENISKAVLNRDRSAGTGKGSVYTKNIDQSNSTQEGSYDFFYNDTHFLRGIYNAANSTPTVPVFDNKSCYSRYFFDEVAQQYGLYNSVGQRVQHNSGMSLLYNDGNNDYYGWIGYYGLWFPDQVNITNGALVNSVTYDQSTGNVVETPYTAFISGGRLIKYTKGTVKLSDVRNIPLNWSEYNATNASYTNYIAIWNGSSETFQKTAIANYTSGTTTAIPYTDIDLYRSGNFYYSVDFWSDSLGGDLRVDLTNTVTGLYNAPTNNTTAIVYNQEAVYPGTEDPLLATNGLVCFDGCPDATPGVINSTNPMYPESNDGTLDHQTKVLPSSGLVNAITYSFDPARMQLIDNASGYDVVLNTPALGSDWGGIQSGPMLINTPANLQSLQCSSGSPNDLCAWKLWDNAPVFYIWQTSPDPWNRMSALKDLNGNFVKFEPPIKVEYTHHQYDSTQPDYKYNDSKFFLQYYGFGDLQGIPGECTDKETGQPVECGPNSWWTPSFSIPTGTELDEAGPDGLFGTGDDIPYLVKALQEEQKMKKTSTLLPCATFTLEHYALPDISAWLEPAIGPMPVVTAPPKVIDGQLQ